MRDVPVHRYACRNRICERYMVEDGRRDSCFSCGWLMVLARIFTSRWPY